MKLSEKQQRFTRNVSLLIQFADVKGLGLTFGHAYRSKAEQEILLSTGASKTIKSKHLDRLAIDFNLFRDGRYQQSGIEYQALGDFWKTLDADNVWGGDWETFRDYGHFEYSG